MRGDLELSIAARDTSIFGIEAAPKTGVVSHVDDVRAALELGAAQRELATTLHRDATAALIEWVRAADEVIDDRSEIARLAGVSRVTLYGWLDGE